MSESNTDGIDSDGSIDHTDPETLERLYWSEGKEVQEIADMSDVTYSTVHYHMEKNGIDRRSNAEVKRKERAGFRTSTNGYEHSICSWFEKQKTLKIHRLVAVAEWGYEKVADNQVHHINGIPWDNRPENIELLSQSEHMGKHAQNGDLKRKLTESDVREIRDKYPDECTLKELGDRFGVSKTTIRNVHTGKTFSWVD